MHQRQSDIRYSSDVNTPQSEDATEQPTTQTPYSIYKPWKKTLIIAGGAVCAFYSPLTGQIYMPALNALSKEFAVTPTKINLTITTYMIFQGITPILFGGLTDTLGRRLSYISCFIAYLSANIALALAQKYSHVLALRSLQSAGSATIMITCQAAVADIVTSAERGRYISITALPSILGPSLGPVIGGALTQYLGWRSIFWFLTICAGTTFILLLVFLPETCRRIVGDGSVRPPPLYRTLWQIFTYRRQSCAQVTENLASLEAKKTSGITVEEIFSAFLLLGKLQLVLLILSGSVVFSGVYAIGTSAPDIFATIYGLNDFKIGLMYLPMAGGSILAAAVVGHGLNWNYSRHARMLGLPVDRSRNMDLSNFPIERARLEVALPLIPIGIVVFVSWGWVVARETHLAAVCVLVFLVGISLVGVNNAIQALITDIFPGRVGAALATYNLVKCLLGAVTSSVIHPIIEAVGLGRAFCIFGGLYVLLLPVIALIMWRGPRWRC